MHAVVDRAFGRMPATGLKPMPAPAPPPLSGMVRRTVERSEQQAATLRFVQ